MTAAVLKQALASRHSDDVFVDECKNGATYTANHRRLDAWAMKRTWSPITTLGYEIKVSRSDWLNDNKLHHYLPLCHLLYIVAPKGVVQVGELPVEVGLLEPVGDKHRLVTRHKAVYRDIELPAQLMVYILMCRTLVTRERSESRDTEWRIDTLKRWTEDKANKQELSYAVNAKIHAKFAEQESRHEILNRRCENLESIRRTVIELGFNPDERISDWQVRAKLHELAGAVEDRVISEIDTTILNLTRLQDRLKVIKGRYAQT